MFLGAFPESRKAITSCMSVRLFVRMENWSPTGRIFTKYDECFSKICRENSNLIKIEQE